MNEPNPAADLMRLVNGYQVSQAIHVAATLGIADQLREGPRSADDLAAATSSHPGSLYRLLRALAAVGVFHEDGDKRFALTPMGDCLRSERPIRSRRGPPSSAGPTSGRPGATCSMACARAGMPSSMCMAPTYGRIARNMPRRVPSSTAP